MKKKLSGSKQKLLVTEIQWHIEAKCISSTILLHVRILPFLPCISCQHHFTLKKGFQTIPIANYITGCFSTIMEFLLEA